MCHRVLRHTAVICTSRSLTVRSTVYRSNALEDEKGEGDNMLVFVDVENINTSEAGVKEFHIVQVSSNSRNWKLQKSINFSEDKDIKLANREKGKLCLKAVRCKQSVENYTFADVVFGNEQIISSTSPCADFFFRSLYSNLKRIETQHGSLHGSCENAVRQIQKCSEVDLNIIVLWKAYVVEDNKQLILEGQHHVCLNAVGKDAFSLPQKQGFKKILGNSDWEDLEQESTEISLSNLFRPESTSVSSRPSVEQFSNLIKTSLHYPETFNHSFNRKSLCIVPVTLLLSNCSEADVDVIIDLRHKTTSPETLEIHGSFTWLGQTQYKLQLKAHEATKSFFPPAAPSDRLCSPAGLAGSRGVGSRAARKRRALRLVPRSSAVPRRVGNPGRARPRSSQSRRLPSRSFRSEAGRARWGSGGERERERERRSHCRRSPLSRQEDRGGQGGHADRGSHEISAGPADAGSEEEEEEELPHLN
ncbi:trafficking protein particle complex subunit 8 [Crotalus adamanteus]|uniref:Trafficking protein particle complex subunit 8 n=1 Tax=Crotalus adamanteus TaxID=8729 RepID=A0AAW1BMJ8_CROAD